MKKSIAFLFLMLSLVFQFLSLIFGKYAALRMNHYMPQDYLMNPYYVISMVCLGLQALSWPLALRRFPLFWSYLFMSALYIMIPLASYYIFKEKVSAANVIGALVIMAGIVLIFIGGQESGNV